MNGELAQSANWRTQLLQRQYISTSLKCLIFIAIFLSFLLTSQPIKAQDSTVCAIYFTGIGCPHCAKTDLFVLEKWLEKYPNFVVVEYEIYQERTNAPLLYQYDEKYNSGLGIPLLIFNQNQSIVGDSSILKNTEKIIKDLKINNCPLIDGSSINFDNLDLRLLPGSPKIWQGEKILIKKGPNGESELLKKLLLQENLKEVLTNVQFEKIEPQKVLLSGQSRQFEQAIKLDDWIFQWNDEGLEITNGPSSSSQEPPATNSQSTSGRLTLVKIISLALADALNPCEFAVLILMLTAILTYDPTRRKNVLLAGLYFILAVFLMYFIYGLVIVRFFQVIQVLASVRIVLYKILGVFAIILGLLNLKDFIRYRPGGFLTEMPMFLRPTVKKIILGITSPKGAFLVGALVTLFLLPCTIGPYIITGGILSPLDLFKVLPYLILYNLIFILPMLVIVLIVYKGLTKIEDIAGWKDKNIRYLHLLAGLIIFGLGLAMILGLV